jgi:hypothetical protein
MLTCAQNEAQMMNLSIIDDFNEIAPTLIKTKETQKVFRIFSDFSNSETYNSENCNQNYNRNKYSLPYKNVKFTANNDYTHAILINKAMPKLTIPKENVIGFSVEPPYYLGINNEFIEYAKENIGAYYIGSLKHNETVLTKPFVSHIGYVWHASFQKISPPKTELMSIIFSDKKETPGQQYRHALVHAILKTNLPIDIFGRGCQYLSCNDSRIKGEFNESQPYYTYKYTIAIENFALDHYVSEKFIDPLTLNTVPLYYGASCADTDFPNQFIRLSGNIKEDMELIEFATICSNGMELTEINRLTTWKKFNLVEHLKELYNIEDDEKPKTIGIPLGMMCTSAYSLDFAHLRTFSFPFDWNQLAISTMLEILNLPNCNKDVELYYSNMFHSLNEDNRDIISNSWFPHDKNDQETILRYTRRTIRLNEIIRDSTDHLVFMTYFGSYLETNHANFLILQDAVLSQSVSKKITFFCFAALQNECYDEKTNTFYWMITRAEFENDADFHQRIGARMIELL